jgi:hypothetical protein
MSDTVPFDPQQIIARLVAEGVDFIVIGGVAATLQGAELLSARTHQRKGASPMVSPESTANVAPHSPSGPYLTMAVLCQHALVEKDDVLSVIRVIDRLVTPVPVNPAVPRATPAVAINLTAVLQFKSGAARGAYMIALRPEAPSGLRMPHTELSILFEGEDRGVNVVIALSMTVEQEGLYWFDVLLDGTLVTRIPLRIVFQWLSVGGPLSATQ